MEACRWGIGNLCTVISCGSPVVGRLDCSEREHHTAYVSDNCIVLYRNPGLKASMGPQVAHSVTAFKEIVLDMLVNKQYIIFLHITLKILNFK